MVAIDAYVMGLSAGGVSTPSHCTPAQQASTKRITPINFFIGQTPSCRKLI